MPTLDQLHLPPTLDQLRVAVEHVLGAQIGSNRVGMILVMHDYNGGWVFERHFHGLDDGPRVVCRVPYGDTPRRTDWNDVVLTVVDRFVENDPVETYVRQRIREHDSRRNRNEVVHGMAQLLASLPTVSPEVLQQVLDYRAPMSTGVSLSLPDVRPPAPEPTTIFDHLLNSES